MQVYFSSSPAQCAEWRPHLERLSAELDAPFTLHDDPATVDPASIDVLVLNPIDGEKALAPFGHVRLIQSIWAGVESYLANPTLPAAPPLCRMVEAGLTEGMTDYIVGHVLRHHIDVDRSIRHSAEARWEQKVPPLSRDRKVGVLGLGALGADAARMLAALRFDVAGWSRSPKEIDGVACHSGPEGLRKVLERSEIVVAILPATAETRHVLNAETLGWLPDDAVVINPGRGSLIDDDALLAALGSGRLRHATLDVFDAEPLPAGHPYWRNPRVTVTPHIAAETRVESAARVVVEQIRRVQRGEPLIAIVDRAAAY